MPNNNENGDQAILDKLAEMEENMKKHMEEQLTKVNETISNLRKELCSAQEAANESKRRANENADMILTLTNKIDGLENIIAKQAVQIQVLQTTQEDQTCRNSRNSIIIRGIQEEAEEQWDDTRRIVCEKMAAKLDLEPSQLSGMIIRIHCGKPPKKNGPRVVHARFFNWNNVEIVKNKWWKNGKGTGIFLDQHYGS